jgi:hypothetical protein
MSAAGPRHLSYRLAEDLDRYELTAAALRPLGLDCSCPVRLRGRTMLRNHAPEGLFCVVPAQPADVGVVSLEGKVILDRRSDPLAIPEVASSMSAAAAPTFHEREIDHRSQQHCRGEEVLCRKASAAGVKSS